VTLLEWENAEKLKSPVLTVSPGFCMNYGGVDGKGEAEHNYAWRSSYDGTLDETLSGAGPGTFIIRETKSIAVLPISASIGVALGFTVLAVWIGYRRMWGDAASTLLEQGLHNMTVRDVEIVGQIMDLKEFTIPELMRRTHVSKITVWRTVQKLTERGLVEPTERTKLAANGLGGRGKPSRVYKYIGTRASEKTPTER
jgi:predicted transcriptional regulator